jgi:cytidylate kinase
MTTSLERVERYLQAQMDTLHRTAVSRTAVSHHGFVTISRQAGAGGHSLAEALSVAFDAEGDRSMFGGWQVFDQKLCEITARDPRFAPALDSLLGEEYRSPARDFFHQVMRATIDQDVVMARVFEVVRSLAVVGKSIIVGRGGSEVTRELAGGVHLRIIAPLEQRTRRMMQLDDVDERTARATIRRLDADRARLVRAHFDADIDDPTLYDAVWNTGSASVAEIASATVTLLRHRLKPESSG